MCQACPCVSSYITRWISTLVLEDDDDVTSMMDSMELNIKAGTRDMMPMFKVVSFTLPEDDPCSNGRNKIIFLYIMTTWPFPHFLHCFSYSACAF